MRKRTIPESPATLSGFLEKFDNRAGLFFKIADSVIDLSPEKTENPGEHFERAKREEGCPPHPVCVQGGTDIP